MPKKIEVVMPTEKVTKGAVKFAENDPNTEWPLNIYLRKEQVAELGGAKTIKVTIEKID